jgi:hypothetical protein
MKKKTLPAIVLGLVLLSAAAPLAGGDIYVGGPWGTRIDRLPYIISAPGAYYLGGNLSYAGSGDGITILPMVNHVTLDLMGFTLNGSGSGRYGIYMNGSKNVEIRNGTATGWTTGIREGSIGGMLHRIINVRAVGNTEGIVLEGRGHLVKGCKATATGVNLGIYIANNYGTVSGCTVKNVDGDGIRIGAGIVNDNVVIFTGAHEFHRYGINCTSPGVLIKGNEVSGCYYGIMGGSGLNVIGNTVDVDAVSGRAGFCMIDDYSNLVDQNTVTGAGAHYNDDYNLVQRRVYY